MNARPDRQALSICGDLLELPEHERVDALDALCGTDEPLRVLVQDLLGRITRSSDALPTGGAVGLDVDRSGTEMGGYHLTRLQGEGGMGSVYLATRDDGGVTREVAVKTMNRRMPGARDLTRFSSEQQALARLHHPYVAAFIDVGVANDGAPFFVMEYVPGKSITEHCDTSCLTIEQRIELWLKVCDAVQSAHRNLVVHRDIKPANVLVSEDGLPKLLDFGVAKLLEDDSHAETTRFARHLTLDYASPERVLRNEVSTADDVYALGVLLFELIAGVKPFRRSELTMENLLRSIAEQYPPSLTSAFENQHVDSARRIASARRTSTRRLQGALRSDVDAIVRKSIHPDVRQRYGSVEELVSDVRRYQRGEPVSAREDSIWYNVRRFVGRHRLGIAAGSVTTVALLVALAVSMVQTRIATEQARRAEAVSSFMQEVLAAPNARWDTTWRGGANIELREVLTLASEHLDKSLLDQPAVRVELYSSLARALIALESMDEAIVQQRKALAILEHQVAADDPLQERARTDMAIVLGLHRTPRANDEADQLLKSALAWLDRYSPEPSMRRAVVIGEMGVAHGRRRNYADAIAYLRRAVAISIAAGAHSDSALHALGLTLIAGYALSLDDTEQTARAYADAVGIYDRIGGDRFSDAPGAYGGLAWMHVWRGDMPRALALAERALQISDAMNGAGSYDATDVRLGVCWVYLLSGELEKAEWLVGEIAKVFSENTVPYDSLATTLQLVRAELMLRRDQPQAALAILVPLENAYGRGLDVSGRRLAAFGEALLRTGDGSRGVETLRSAREQLGKRHSDASPLFVRIDQLLADAS